MQLTKIFKSIAEDTRLRILRLLLKSNFNVNEILFIIGGRQSNISHHLKVLLDTGIVANKKEGSQIYYKLNNYHNDPLLKSIIQLIKTNRSQIPMEREDIQRQNIIFSKRKKIAEEYFNNMDDNDNIHHMDMLEQLYSIDEYLHYFSPGCKNLIDIGCGNGRNIPLLAKYSDMIIGVDSSPKMLQLSEHICETLNIKYDLKLADINILPFETGTIDGIFMNMVLHHIPDPGGAIEETARVLHEGGKLLLIEFLEHQDDTMRDRYADLWLGFSTGQLESWLTSAGMQISRIINKSNAGHTAVIITAEKIVQQGTVNE